MKDHYQVLGVSIDSSQDEIKKAYRSLAMRHHPDHNPTNQEEAEEKFKEIHAAYEVLGDASARRQYDCLVLLSRMVQENMARGARGNASVSPSDKEALRELLRQLAKLSPDFPGVGMGGCGRGRGFGRRCRRW